MAVKLRLYIFILHLWNPTCFTWMTSNVGRLSSLERSNRTVCVENYAFTHNTRQSQGANIKMYVYLIKFPFHLNIKRLWLPVTWDLSLRVFWILALYMMIKSRLSLKGIVWNMDFHLQRFTPLSIYSPICFARIFICFIHRLVVSKIGIIYV